MEVKVRCSKFECREEIHFKTQPGPVAKNATPRSTELINEIISFYHTKVPEILMAVSFSKGCFIGFKLTTRIGHSVNQSLKNIPILSDAQ